MQDQIQQRLLELTPTDSLALQAAWQAAVAAVAESKPPGKMVSLRQAKPGEGG